MIQLLIDFVDWWLRNLGKLILLALLALVVLAYWWVTAVYDDLAQRDRFATAAIRTHPIREAVDDQFKKTGKFPSDFGPFVKEPRYTVEHSKLGRIGFSVNAEGQRLRILFDADQGPFAEKVLIYQGTETNGSISWTCLAQDIPSRYVPGVCSR